MDMYMFQPEPSRLEMIWATNFLRMRRFRECCAGKTKLSARGIF
jgi:hypothetical protein